MFLRDSGCTGKVTSYNEFTVYYSDRTHSNVIANIEYKTCSNILS